MHLNKLRDGMTLVELLTVLGVVGVLIGLLLPAVQSVRESARLTVCKNNLRQVSFASMGYESAHDRFPPGQVTYESVSFEIEALRSSIGHLGFLFHYLEQPELAEKASNKYVVGSQDPWYYNAELFEDMSVTVPVLRCPADPQGVTPFTLVSRRSLGIQDMVEPLERSTNGWTNYLGSSGSVQNGAVNQGVFFENSNVGYQDITDGSSQTFLMGEVVGGYRSPQGRLEARHSMLQNGMSGAFGFFDIPAFGGEPLPVLSNFSSSHWGGSMVNFSLADGSVHTLNRGLELEVLFALSTRAGQEQESNEIF